MSATEGLEAGSVPAEVPRAGSGVLRLRLPDRRPIPLRFWRDGVVLYVAATEAAGHWPSVLLSTGGAPMDVDGVRRECAVSLVTDPSEEERVLGELRSEYGPATWSHHFAGPLRLLRIEPGKPALRPTGRERIQGEFDSVASDYARRVAQSPRQRYLKDRTTAWLVRELAGVDPLLEVGPGAGIETLPLLARGHTVVAVDIAPRMLAELRRRAEVDGLGSHLTTIESSLSDLPTALARFPPGTFGAAYSTFGAFNLESDLGSVGPALGRALRPGGKLLFTSLSRPGAIPLAWEVASGHLRQAAARMGTEISAEGVRFALDVYLRSPPFWDGVLGPTFQRVSVRPASVLAPPFDSPRLLRWLGAEGARRAGRFDGWLSRAAWLSPLAEWALLEYRRVVPDPTTPPPTHGVPGRVDP